MSTRTMESIDKPASSYLTTHCWILTSWACPDGWWPFVGLVKCCMFFHIFFGGEGSSFRLVKQKVHTLCLKLFLIKWHHAALKKQTQTKRKAKQNKMCEWIRYFCGVCKCVCRSCAFALEGQMSTLDVIPQKLIPLFLFLSIWFYLCACLCVWMGVVPSEDRRVSWVSWDRSYWSLWAAWHGCFETLSHCLSTSPLSH